MVASPLSSASCFTSSTRTGMPALAKHMAMPPPIVPAPITAAEWMGRAGNEVTLDQLIEEAGLGQHRRGHSGAGDDQVERGLQAEHARKPLRPASAWNEADLHFRQGDLCRRRRDAIVAAQGELEAAA